MFTSGTPRFVSFEPRYPTSKLQVLPIVFCTDKFHCWAYPLFCSRLTPKTPWPRPISGLFGSWTCVAGPCDSANAGKILSGDRCPAVWINGNNGVVQGV